MSSKIIVLEISTSVSKHCAEIIFVYNKVILESVSKVCHLSAIYACIADYAVWASLIVDGRTVGGKFLCHLVFCETCLIHNHTISSVFVETHYTLLQS